jgi:hypothetical protein
MSEFLLVFRRDYTSPEAQPSTQALQDHLKHWADWLRSIAAQDKIAHPVIRFDSRGKIVTAGNVKPGPYRGGNESIGGVLALNVANYEEAIDVATGSPILDYGGTVEIRQIMQ